MSPPVPFGVSRSEFCPLTHQEVSRVTVMIPALEKMAHLAMAFCDARHYKAQRWLTRLGAEPIAPILDEWGRERESFILYGWRR